MALLRKTALLGGLLLAVSNPLWAQLTVHRLPALPPLPQGATMRATPAPRAPNAVPPPLAIVPLFCRLEHQWAKKLAMPVKFRLGSVPYVDWLEGKGRNY